MYVSSWPGLTLRELLSHGSKHEAPYPLNAPKRKAFYLARSGIFHLFQSLRLKPDEVVLVPDYYSGNEVSAIRAAGSSMVHYPIGRDLQPDLDVLLRLAKTCHPRVIYVIHYLGWSQPMKEIESVCREHGCILIEDCALSMLSETGGKALGTFGDYSVFCLYKTLPVPNGGLLVQNNMGLPELDGLQMEPCPPMGAVGRSAELVLESLRSRSNAIGKTLVGIKQLAGRMLRTARFRHVPVGDIGWNIGNVNLAMSSISDSVMSGLDYEHIRKRRRDNFLRMRQALHGQVTILRDDLDEGVCPLFFPILVKDKHAAAQSLWQQGIGAVEFWNDKQDNPSIGPGARYLRSHVLELPIHQDVTPSQVDYIAGQVLRLKLERMPC
jgi:perosamine synthetase